MKLFYIILLVAGLVLGIKLLSGSKSSAATTEVHPDSSLYCYNPDATNTVNNDQSGFKPTITDSTLKIPAPIQDMVWVSGGEFSMGAPDPVGMKEGGSENMHDARPVHRVHVGGFYMDVTEVTNAQFRKFIKATGYRTLAEIKPTKEEFPAMDEEDLKAGSIVFTPPAEPVAGADYHAWWSYVPGADWQHPLGPQSNITGMDNLPVVHISWPDAVAYAKWAGKRLPTEAEWEFAARGGKAGGLYTWGNELKPAAGWAANIFQGHFPEYDKGEDGYKGIGRVSSYAPNGYGLYDMAGNVWEWCSDWYQPDYYSQLAGNVTHDPKGPDAAVLSDQQEKRKIQRGGSFLCTSQYCTRYMVGSRGKGEWHSSSNHVGFRCVKEPD